MISRYPTVFAATSFALGIMLAAPFVDVMVKAYILLVFILLLIYNLVFYREGVLPILFCVLTLFAGAVCLLGYSHKMPKYQGDGEKVRIVGRVADIRGAIDPQLYLDVLDMSHSQEGGRISLRVDGGRGIDYSYGDIIETICVISPPKQASFRGDEDTVARFYTYGIWGMARVDVEEIQRRSGEVSLFDLHRWGVAMRQHIWRTNETLYSPGGEALITAIMLGDKSGFDDELATNVREKGLEHVIAVSGMHISIVLFFIVLLLPAVGSNRSIGIIIFIVLAAFYYTVGFAPSVARAVIMAIVTLAASIFRRRREIYSCIFLSALIIFAMRPYALFEVGCQLSFVCTIALALSRGKGEGTPFRRVTKELVGLSAACVFATVPVTVSVFGRICLGSIVFGYLANLLAFFILLGGYIASILYAIVPPAAALLSNMVEASAQGAIRLFGLAEEYPLLLEIKHIRDMNIIVYVAFLVVIYLIINKKLASRREILVKTAVLLASLAIALSTVQEATLTTGKSVIRAREGTLVRADDGASVLIGAAVGEGRNNVVSRMVWESGVKKLDAFILNDLSRDTGALGIIREFKPSLILLPEAKSEAQRELIRKIFEGRGEGDVEYFEMGESLAVGEYIFVEREPSGVRASLDGESAYGGAI